MAQTQVLLGKRSYVLTRREQLALVEISHDQIDSASSFVDYISDYYGISKSSVWHTLKSMRDVGLLEFATKDDTGKPLSLTRHGIKALQSIPDKEAVIRSFEQPEQADAPQHMHQLSDMMLMRYHRETSPRVEGEAVG